MYSKKLLPSVNQLTFTILGIVALGSSGCGERGLQSPEAVKPNPEVSPGSTPSFSAPVDVPKPRPIEELSFDELKTATEKKLNCWISWSITFNELSPEIKLEALRRFYRVELNLADLDIPYVLMTTSFLNIMPDGEVGISYAASTEEMEDHLRAQKSHYKQIKLLKEQVEAKLKGSVTMTYGASGKLSQERYLEVLESLNTLNLDLTARGINSIIIHTENKDCDLHGAVRIDYRKSPREIQQFILSQKSRYAEIKALRDQVKERLGVSLLLTTNGFSWKINESQDTYIEILTKLLQVELGERKVNGSYVILHTECDASDNRIDAFASVEKIQACILSFPAK